jgi:hypothetical protein
VVEMMCIDARILRAWSSQSSLTPAIRTSSGSMINLSIEYLVQSQHRRLFLMCLWRSIGGVRAQSWHSGSKHDHRIKQVSGLCFRFQQNSRYALYLGHSLGMRTVVSSAPPHQDHTAPVTALKRTKSQPSHALNEVKMAQNCRLSVLKRMSRRFLLNALCSCFVLKSWCAHEFVQHQSASLRGH